MLTQLYIENIAVIEQVSLDFGKGLNVLTGETGAGKSMIIDALHSVLGERMTRDSIRAGAEKAFVSAAFDRLSPGAAAALEENGFPSEEDGTLLVQRTLTADGKSICRINGRPATVSVLKQITPLLLNIHGQHESYLLLSPNLHMQYIDRMGELEPLLVSYQQAYRKMRGIRSEWKSLQMDEEEKQERMDFLRYRIDELKKAALRPGERENLTERRDRYRNSERIAGALSAAKTILSGGDESDGVTAMLSTAEEELSASQAYLKELPALTERLREIGYELQDMEETLRDLSREVEYDPVELEQIEQRLDLLHRLSKKYGDTEEDMLNTLRQMEKELSEIELSEETLSRLEREYEIAKTEAIDLARKLSFSRKEASEIFSRKVMEELQFLNMPGIRFSVLQERVPLNALGCDKMEFLIAANPGEEPKPMAKIASGGELSRIMLAIKTVLSGGDEIDTLVFDEVDTGVSGSTAEKVGLKLRQVSRDRQVLCVTHLAQIASLADHHYKIRKDVENGRTYTRVEQLGEEERCREIARIMGGSEITQLTLQNAAEMLRRGREIV